MMNSLYKSWSHLIWDGVVMDTNKKNREHISALGDGELPETEVELAFAALHSVDGKQAWFTYHHIGDALRAAAAPDLSDRFHAALAARLAQEPSYGKRAERTEAVAEPPHSIAIP
jgi:sigma-E factor negative regulatory protein RseA